MRFRRHCLLIAVQCLLICVGGLFWPARATVLEGSADEYTCDWEWHPWALSALFYDHAGSFYEIAHGGSRLAYLYCGRDPLTPDYVAAGGYSVGFFASCSGMCSNADGTFAESVEEAVGYCGMGDEPICMTACWATPTLQWQNYFYQELLHGAEVEAAFNAAQNAVPECIPCFRYHKKREPDEVNPTETTIVNIIVPWYLNRTK